VPKSKLKKKNIHQGTEEHGGRKERNEWTRG